MARHKRRLSEKRAAHERNDVQTCLLGEALQVLKDDWGWGSLNRPVNVAGIPTEFRFVVLREGGRRMRSDKTITFYASPAKQKIDISTVRQLLRQVAKRLAMPQGEAFAIRLVGASGELVNGNKRIENLGSETWATNYEESIEKEIEKLDDSIEGPLWEKFAEYDGEDEEEFLYIFTRSWVRSLLRKMGKRKFRKLLREESVW